MPLPQAFVDKMKKLLGDDEYGSFRASLNGEKTVGLRVNRLKVSPGECHDLFPFPLEPVPFCPDGFYIDPDAQAGKHPFHQSGLYYMQEPSAMFPATVLAPQKHEKVLDLCAAPGGKATHLAALMADTGLLVANEIHPARVKALSENIERMGITNAVVTNETPEKLAERFPGFFDRILVDAPCSGEGMFRKDPEAMTYWSCDHVDRCSRQQSDILDAAYAMLNEGGTLVYSTCTFSPEENEQVMEAFIRKYPDMELLPVPKTSGIRDGVVRWSRHRTEVLSRTARLWPHHLRGEGHFVALLKKNGSPPAVQLKPVKSSVRKQDLQLYREFEKDYLNVVIERPMITIRSRLYALPPDCPELKGLKVVRSGLHLGELKKNRFEPNHALAMALKREDVKHTLPLSLEDERWKKYLRGETIHTGDDRGWLMVTIEGFPLGWGKEVKGTVKNFYPKGLRLPMV
ncbi:MAG: RsmF rRNA methyltransferase first C-terminal domain-containing protein [Bacillaceae bacterium]|nr:RsmF rRNA methyltransferase first C-terminal domain-containing protein [Bacillaceae bacterium]